jgi:DNA-binding NtrC family response regulator
MVRAILQSIRFRSNAFPLFPFEDSIMTSDQIVDLLVVDDDDDFRTIAARRFQRDGYQVQQAANGDDALALAQRRQFDVAILDLRMPGMSGLELLEQLRVANPECQTIILTGEGSVQTAVQAMKLGAYDYLTKPFSLAELEIQVQRAYERRALDKENQQLKAVLQNKRPRTQMIGASPAMQEVFRLIERAGPSEKAILIQGESGTGKELVALAVHQASCRADKPLVVINCAALPETLLESELFGHEKGSFTGAVATKPGLFEAADGGTLFIDEIGELPASLQAKMLRVLEDGSIRRIGSVKERRVNVRLLAATNRDLAKEIQAGRFREDLYYRINVMLFVLPPLRRRMEDVPLLVDHFLQPNWRIEPNALAALQGYSWPGNVRQLINVLERGKILADDGVIRLGDLPDEVIQPTAAAGMGHPSANEVSAPDDLATVERTHVVDMMRRQRGNKARVARALGIGRRSVYRLVDKYSIRPDEWEPAAPSARPRST